MLTGSWHLVMRLDPVFSSSLFWDEPAVRTAAGYAQALEEVPQAYQDVRPGTEKQMEQASAWLFSGLAILLMSHGLQGTSLYRVLFWNW